MILELNGEQRSKRASDADVAKAIASLPMFPEDDSIAVLSSDDATYLQAGITAGGDWWLEYQSGSTDEHYSCEQKLDEGAVVRAFTWYLHADERWRTEQRWEKMELGPPKAGSIALTFDTLSLVVWSGVLGILPAAIWVGALATSVVSLVTWAGSRWVPASHWSLAHGGGLEMALTVVGIALLMFTVLIGPSLAAALVQRARQPWPARIDWNGEGLVEWNGTWPRATIPWPRLEVAWQRQALRSGSSSALQLRDRESRALIHVWAFDPPGVPPARRRVFATVADLRALIEVLEARDPTFAEARAAALATGDQDATVGAPDWALAIERPRPSWMVGWGRLGYVGAVVAPVLGVGPPSPSGIAPTMIAASLVAVVSATLLLVRAAPVHREWQATGREVALVSGHEAQVAALRQKRKAVGMEMILRYGFAAMVIYSTIAAVLFSLAHP